LQSGTGTWWVICPINTFVDQTYYIEAYVVGGVTSVTFDVFYDTLQYPESVFYNGQMKAASLTLVAAGGPTTVVNGPARLLTIQTDATGGAVALVFISGTQVQRVDSGANNTLTFPPNTIIPAGSVVALQQVGAGAAICSVTLAYP